MSKANKKDKKNQATGAIQQAYQAQKRQLLDCHFSIRKFQERCNDLTTQNLMLKSKLEESGQLFNQSLEQMALKNMANQKRLLVLSNEKTKLQIQNEQKQNRIKIIQKNLFQQQQLRIKDFEEMKKNYNFELTKYQSQLSEYRLYMNERDELEQQRQDLREKIEIQKANKLRDIADKEKQKVQATDKLKDQMLFKINEMRKNLLSLKKEQLSTTTRLTMLQNHQLTSQLQYQSKQTEKIIFKNQELEHKNIALKQQLDIHKEVEEELAKRSHFSKGIIRKLNLRITQLQKEIEQLKNQLCLPKSNINSQNFPEENSNFRSKQNNDSEYQQKKKFETEQNLKHIKNLQQSLSKNEKKYAQLSTKYEMSLKEKEISNNKLQSFNKTANELFNVLQKYYYEILSNEKNEDKAFETRQQKSKEKENKKIDESHLTEDFIYQNVPYNYDLKQIREKPVDQWKTQDVTITVQILLNAIRPYLQRSNLLIPAVRKNIVLSDNIKTLKNEEAKSNKSLPKLLTERKQQIHAKIQQIPINLASKIVGSNLRQWGNSLKLNKTSLSRKYKLSHSYRG